MAEIKVSVTAEDIAMGKREDCSRCPVALAVMRATGCEAPYVHNDYIIAGRMYDAPESVDRFISMFDLGYEVRPFEFTLSEAAP